MRWASLSLITLSLQSYASTLSHTPMTSLHLLHLRDSTKSLWQHGFNQYMKHAFPRGDELRPLSCTPLSHNYTAGADLSINDVCGDFIMTLVDVLDSFVKMRDFDGFEKAVTNVIKHLDFDKNSTVQVFETTIRVLGGLLSAHIYASTAEYGYSIPWYKGELLDLAVDLGNRLLPAFTNTTTGLPWPRVNLRHGVIEGISDEQCAAGAGSLLLEFATLSRLTGNPEYEIVAKKALMAVWDLRSSLDLVGNGINITTGQWLSNVSSVGAGVDSLFEYIAKGYVLLGDQDLYQMWIEAYSAIKLHMRSNDEFWYRSVDMHSGYSATTYVDSLSSFWPGTMVLMGELEAAIKSHSIFENMWQRYRGIPEVFNVLNKNAENFAWPFRPEFVESTLFLYQATKDPYYLHVGEMILHDITNRTKVDCGLAAVDNLITGKLDDRMHSFALSETLPYLYLLFDVDNPINTDSSNAVFTTEGHFLKLDRKYLKSNNASSVKPAPRNKKSHKSGTCSKSQEPPTCPAYNSSTASPHPLARSVHQRTTAEYSRALTSSELEPEFATKYGYWDPYFQCAVQDHTQDYTVDLIFTEKDEMVDLLPSKDKVRPIEGGVLVKNLRALHFHLVRRMDGMGYDVTQAGPYKLKNDDQIYMADAVVVKAMLSQTPHLVYTPTYPILSFSTPNETILSQGVTAVFGSDAAAHPAISTTDFSLQKAALPATRIPWNRYGCNHYVLDAESHATVSSSVLLVHRGHCSFATKMQRAVEAGAKAVIILGDTHEAVVASADGEEMKQLHGSGMIPMVYVANGTTEWLEGREQVEVRVVGSRKSPEKQMITIYGYLVANMVMARPV